MSARAASRLGWCLFAVSAALLVAGTAVVSIPPSAKIPAADRWDVLGVLFSLAYLVFSLVGALIVSRRRENSVGWLFCAIGFVNAVWVFTLSYAIRAVAGETNWLPAGHAAAWLANVLPIPGGWLLLPVLFLFPTGRPLSARWRRLIWLGGLTMGAGMIAAAFEPGPVAQIEVGVDNPLGIASLRGPLGTLDHLLGNFGVLQTLLAAAGVACLIVRFRHGERQERLQLKWFAYASGFALLMMVVLAAHSIAKVGGENDLADTVASTLLFLAWVAIPIAVGVAILRYRLYDIDVVINRTLVYASLTAILVGVYFGGVTATQALFRTLTSQEKSPQLVVVASTLVIAALFNPLRRRIQSFIDRSFFRNKYDAAKTLEGFSMKLRDETDLNALSGDLVGVVRETMQPAHVSLWLHPDPALKDKRKRAAIRESGRDEE
jgi:hypothetical protein